MTVFSMIGDRMYISVPGLAAAMGIDAASAINTIKTLLKEGRKYNRASYQSVADPADARKRWIWVDSLPARTHDRVVHYYGGDIAAYYQYERWISIINMSIDPADGVWYITQGIADPKAKQYARSCAWIRLAAGDTDTDQYASMQLRYEMIITAMSNDSGHSLRISHWRTLRTKVKAYETHGRASLLSGKRGNSNASKIDDMAIRFIINSYASALKPSYRDVTRIYNAYAPDQGWKLITEERVRQLLHEKEIKQAVMLARDGAAVFRNTYERTIKRRKPSFADALWTLDGFTIQLRYQESGKPMSDMYAVAIMDVYSDCVVGYALGQVENAVLVQQAIRAAIRNTMKKPLQLQYDNSSANKSAESQELFDRIARWSFPTAPYNGKSKPIENLIGRLEGHNMRHMPNFKGGNITSHSLAIKANPEYLQNQDLPEYDTVTEQVRIIIEVHNNTTGTDGRTPLERYRDAHEMRRDIDYIEMVQAFWVERREAVRYTKDGLTIEVNKERYTYEVETTRGIEDMDFRSKWLGTRFTVKYDPDDLEYISLWHEGKHIAEAHQKWEAPMAIVDMEPGDRSIIDQALSDRKAYVKRMHDKVSDIRESIAEDKTLPAELNYYDFHKDAYNRREQRMIDEDISQAALAVIGYTDQDKKKKPKHLYGNDEGSMQVID